MTITNLHRWRAFALLALAYFMTCVDLTVVNVSLPTIGRDLHFSATSLQWVVTAYALGYGGFLLLGGRIADLFGRRRVLMSALGVFSAASLGCALAPSDTVLITSRAVQGLGAAVMLPTAMAIVTSIFDEGPERNKALGIWGALGATGGTVGLLTGGLITRYLGWQYIFYLNVPIGTLALALAPRLLPRGASQASSGRFDLPGALAGTGGLVLLADAISQSPQYGWGSGRTIAVLGAAASLLAAFLVIENCSESPVLPLSIFRLRTLTGAITAGLLIGGSFFAFLFIGTLYMQQVLHFSALQTGLAWMSGSVPSIVFAGVSQRLVTRRGPKGGAGARRGPRRRGGPLGNPDPGPRALPSEPRGPVRARRRRNGVLVHPDLDRGARGCPPAPGRARLGADEHLHTARSSIRDRDRLKRRRKPHAGAAAHRHRRPRGARRRLPPRAVAAGSDRAARPPGDLHLHPPQPPLRAGTQQPRRRG